MGFSHPAFWHFSFRIVTGLLYPAGNNGGGLGGSFDGGSSFFGVDFDEFPAFPDRTTLTGRLLGAMGMAR
jgi:hypothetical protein